MGGYRSTRWNAHELRPVAEETPSLDVGLVVKWGAMDHRHVRATHFPEEQRLGLFYIHQGEAVLTRIDLTSTPCTYGGKRWWALCPMCGQRCAKLFKVWSSKHYACQKCQNITYRSSRESHQFDRGWCAYFDIERVVKSKKLVRLLVKLERTRPGSRRWGALIKRAEKITGRPFHEWIKQKSKSL